MSTVATGSNTTVDSTLNVQASSNMPQETKKAVGRAAAKADSKDEICDDWEQLDPQKIEKSLQSIKLNSQQNTVQNEEKSFTNLNSTAQNTPNPNPAPAPTTFKILKRPQSNKNLLESSNPNQNTSSQNLKTYEQRQEEYAQARLRILGSAHPEQDAAVQNNNARHSQSNSNFNQNASGNSDPSSYSNTSNNRNFTINANQRGGGSNINNSNGQFNRYQQSNEFGVARDPVGPDGSQGFRGNNFNSNSKNNNLNNSNSNKNFISK